MSVTRREFLKLTAVGLPVNALLASCGDSASRPTVTVRLAESPTAASGLFYVALDNGYFAEDGIAFEATRVASGKEALALVTSGKADLCMVAEAPIVHSIQAGNSIRILATIESNERNTGIIIPADSPIGSPSDLLGQRVGYFPGTASEYFLSVFLNANSLPTDGIAKVHLQPKDAHEALARGEVDAIAGWQEVRLRADKALGARTRAMYADGVYMETWNLVGPPLYLDQNLPVAEGILRALIKAQAFAAANQSAAIGITAKHIGFTEQQVAELWPSLAFDVSLDQTLVTNLEGHWRVLAKGASGAGQAPPNLVSNLYPAALDAVDTGRVTFFR